MSIISTGKEVNGFQVDISGHGVEHLKCGELKVGLIKTLNDSPERKLSERKLSDWLLQICE